jgi:prespore-specific regulator
MSKYEEWTDEEDLLLAEVVLRHIRENSTMINAFDEAGQKLNRTTAACGYRWNSVIRHHYINAIAFAKKQREIISMRVDKLRKKWRQEEDEFHERIGSIKGKIQSIRDEALHNNSKSEYLKEEERNMINNNIRNLIIDLVNEYDEEGYVLTEEIVRKYEKKIEEMKNN